MTGAEHAAWPAHPFDAIVLAGGSGLRLGGIDKATVVVAGATLLERAVQAVGQSVTTVVVGPDRGRHDVDGPRIVVTSEDPRGGGPVAAVAAGLPHTRQDIVVVLACDMPLVGADLIVELVGRLGAAGPEVDAALALDETGRRQYLAGAYRARPLTAAIASLDHVAGAAMRAVANRLTVLDVMTDSGMTLDADTWEDVERSRRLLEEP